MKSYLSLFLAFVISSEVWSQSIVWNFNTSSPSTTVSGITGGPISQGNNNGTTPLLDSNNPSSGYTNASGGNNATLAARGRGEVAGNDGLVLAGPDASGYFQFTLTPDCDNTASVSGMSFGYWSTFAGPTKFSVRSSSDNYGADIASGTMPADVTWYHTGTLTFAEAISIPQNGSVTFRIYGYDPPVPAGMNIINWRIDDLSMNVSVTQKNQAPSASATGLNPSVTSSSTPADLFGSVTVSNCETSQSINSLKLTISGVANGTNEKLIVDGTTLSFENSSGTTATNSLDYNFSVSGSTGTLILSKVGGASNTVFQNVIDNLSYQNNQGAPVQGTRTVTLTEIVDNGGTANGGNDTQALALSSTVSVSIVPSISSATYDASSGALIVTGINFSSNGAGADVDASKITLTGEGGATYTLTDTSDPEITNSTSFTLSLSATDKAAFNLIANKNGTSSTSGTTYNLAAAEDWLLGVDLTFNIADLTGNIITVSNVAVPAITSATYNSSTGVLVVTGTNFVKSSGSSNDIVANKIRFTGQGGANYTLTDTQNGEISNGTSFTLVLSASDRLALSSLLNKDGTTALDGTVYNLAALEDWAAGIDAAVVVADLTGNSITVSLASPAPVVTSVTSSTADGTYKIGDVISVQIVFDQTVTVDTGLGTPTVSLETGTTDELAGYVSGSGTSTLSFQYTVQEGNTSLDLDYTGTGALALNGGKITDSFDQDAVLTLPSPGAAGSLGANKSLVIDGIRPIVTSVSVPVNGTYVAGQNLDFTVNFSEAVTVTGTPQISLTIGSSTKQASYVSGSGSSALVFRYTVQSGDLDTNGITVGTLALNDGSITDVAGNNAVLTLNSVGSTTLVLVDAVEPSVTIVVSDTFLSIGETSTVTITFNEAISGLTIADFTVENGTLSGLSSSDGGVTWTATLTPDSGVQDATNLITLDNTGYQDSSGNSGSGTSNSNNYQIDTQRPSAGIVVTDAELISGETSLVTITFSEAITGLSLADFTVANGSMSGLSSSDGGITWTATLTPSNGVEDPSNVITLDNTGYADAGGNLGIGTTDSNNYTVDTILPTVIIVVSDTEIKLDETSVVTFIFDVPVSGFTNSDLTVPNGNLSPIVSSDGGKTWTAIYYPFNDIEDPTNLIILNNSGYTDLSGNPGLGTTNSNNFVIDTKRPTATISLSDSNLKSGETSVVTIIFSEKVTGFTNADLSVENGSLTSVSSSDGGKTWSAVFTPANGIEDSNNILVLNNSGISDLAGNAGVGTTNSDNFTIDTNPPSVIVVVKDTELILGENTVVTFIFSSQVAGFDNADVTVPNGNLSPFATTDGGKTWTAIYFPFNEVEDPTNQIVLNNAGYSDLAGNPGSGTTNSNNFAIDTKRPSAAILVNDNKLSIGETSLVTITFTEAVKGLDLADFEVENGTLSGLSTEDQITWTATLTPAPSIEDAENKITLSLSGIQDLPGNSGIGNLLSNSYLVDTKAPTVITKGLTLFLNSEGKAALTPDLVDNGSTDGFGIDNRNLDKTSFDCSDLGENTVTLTVTDIHGNQASETAIVTIVDNLAPIPSLATLPNITETCQLESLTAPTALDNCGGLITATTEESFPIKSSKSVVWKFVDASGNVTNQTQEIIIVDTSNPEISNVPEDFEVILYANAPYVLPDFTQIAKAEDNCELISFTQSPSAGTVYSQPGIIEVTLTATDRFDNKTTASFTITLSNRLIIAVENPPMITVPWNTPIAQINLPKEVTVTLSNGEKTNLPVNWNTTGYNQILAAVYQLEGTLVLGDIENPEDYKPNQLILVLDKIPPTDILLSSTVFAANGSTNLSIGTLSTVDSQDNIHTYELVNPSSNDGKYFRIEGNELYWNTTEPLPGKVSFTIVVRSTDRVGNSIEKTFVLTRTRIPIDQVEIFNSFTPDGDGKNDFWGVPDLQYFSGGRVQVFDRSGQRIFYTESPAERWDGTFEGKEMPVGSYFWILESKETGEIRRGVLTLLRD